MGFRYKACRTGRADADPPSPDITVAKSMNGVGWMGVAVLVEDATRKNRAGPTLPESSSSKASEALTSVRGVAIRAG